MQHQQQIVVFLALLVATAAVSTASQTKAYAVATAWLTSRGSVAAPDELAALKDANPEAYALVKALLVKKSMGLLNTRHPTASFGDQPEQPPAESGPAAFGEQAEEKPAEAAAAEVAPEHHAHQNFMNWRPQDSAANDDAMVQNVLAAVAEAKGQGGFLKKRSVAEPSDEEVETAQAEPAPAPEVETAQAEPAPAPVELPKPEPVSAPVETAQPAAQHQANSWAGFDLSAVMAPHSASLASKKTAVKQEAVAPEASHHHANAYMMDFSDDDATPAKATPAPDHHVNAYLTSFASDDSAAETDASPPASLVQGSSAPEFKASASLVQDFSVSSVSKHWDLGGIDLSAGVPTDTNNFDFSKEAAEQQVKSKEEKPARVEQNHIHNSYFGDVDLSASTPMDDQPKQKTNPYLDGLDLVAKHTQTDYLSEFSFDDNAAPKPPPVTQMSRAEQVMAKLKMQKKAKMMADDDDE